MQSISAPAGVLSSGGILDRIVEAKASRLRAAREIHPIGTLASATRDSSRTRFSEALTRDGINVIAEIKRRSPSKGVIRENFDPTAIAESYANGGATAISVLTEEDFFDGSLEYLTKIRGTVPVPLLRKDFIFDEYQILEAVQAGADAVLLITAILDDSLLRGLIQLASERGLDALVEVHDDNEMRRAVEAGAAIIGVNNRDLRTFDVALETSERLATLAPADTILVTESGIERASDIRRLRSSGFRAFLIGEHLMRAPDPGEALRALLAEASESR